jgi:pimeloyl-ACP methyl ester carboxylesterase
MSYRSQYATCAGREIHYTEWGPQHATAVIAWHGLARTGRDMDELAGHLSSRYRVICPDTIGRGLSQWSPDPHNEYTLAFYAGGLAQPALKGRIKSLVLNDNAPHLADAAVARIRAYAGNPPAFATVTELEAFFRQVYKPFGWLSDAQWRRLAETSTRRLPDGRVTPHYDPAMVRQFIDHPNDYEVWAHYAAIEVPVLCLRGAESDLVLRETTDEMLRRGPGLRGLARIVEVAGCGHAPALNVPEQLDLVASFFDRHELAPAATASHP